ncbi:MAG TPA: universal stress protein [Candidatus Limnocylindria bacterium]|nr:universal stress protein [Candidatus Limnocylindria bacterium]
MRIVIGVDGSGAARVATEFVAKRTWPVGTRVTLVAAVEPVVDWSGLAPMQADRIDEQRAALEAVLDEPAEELRIGNLVVETAVEVGFPADRLIAVADEQFADLIVVGNRGRGPATSAVLGSVSAHLVDHAPCPVLVVRSPSASRMLLATDGTPSSQSIPRVLAAWGPAFRGLHTEVLSVASRDGFVTPWAPADSADADLVLHEGIAQQVADEMLELGWETAAVVRTGDPSHEIVQGGREWGADLIVTGSRGLGTLERLLRGSVAHDVLLHTHSSVLVVRGLVPARRTARARALTAAFG